MKQQLNELVAKYNMMGRKADERFYHEFFRIAKESLDLDDYLTELVFIPKEEHMNAKYQEYTKGFGGMFGQAAYRAATGELVVYERNINYGKVMDIRSVGLEATDSEVSMYNLMVLQTLLHEIEHAKQAKMKKEGTDFESKLIQICDTDVQETTETYEYSITERLAEIRSFEQVLDMYDEIGLFDQRIYDYFDAAYKECMLRGYHFEDAEGYLVNGENGIFVDPTTKYLKLKNGNVVEYNELIKDANDDTRMYYGMNVPLEYYLEYKANYGSYKM